MADNKKLARIEFRWLAYTDEDDEKVLNWLSDMTGDFMKFVKSVDNCELPSIIATLRVNS